MLSSFNFPTLTVFTRGYKLFIEPATYTGLSMYTNGAKTLLIMAADQIILGTVFFKNYNVVFDKKRKRVGFDGST